MKRRHHTVPKFYLARFANETGQLRRTALAEPEKAHLISISDATVEKDFYLIQEEDGSFDDRVEDLLALIEGEGARGFKNLFDDDEWPISKETRWRVSQWIALQYLRGPAERQMFNEMYDVFFKLDVAVQGREGMRRALNHNADEEATEEEIDEMYADFTDTEAFHIEAHPNEHIRSMLENVEGITRSIYSRSWTLIRFERRTLLLSDHPIALIASTDHPPFMGIGILSAEGVVFPVDRRMALVMGWPPETDKDGLLGTADHRIVGTANIAKWVNQAIMNTARKALFTHPEDAHLTAGPLPEPRDREIQAPDYDQWRTVGEQLNTEEGRSSEE